MFDFAVCAHFPAGLYLAQQLSRSGFKTAYVEIVPQRVRPFPLLLGETSEQGKHFLQSLGFLKLQEGGFCILSPQGVWPLQDMRAMAGHCPVIKNALRRAQPEDFKDFSKDWLSWLSLNLSGRVFDGNLCAFSSDRLDLFKDCFLFSPSLKKIRLFKKDHPDIAFYSLLNGSVFWDETAEHFVINPSPQGQNLREQEGFSNRFPAKIDSPPGRFEPESQKYIWLSDPPPFVRQGKWALSPQPLWQWRSGFLKADFGDYESLIPSHFLLIKDIFLPWSHDNLFSVFHHSGLLEVWSRQAFGAVPVPGAFLSSARAQLEAFFKGGRFSFSERRASEEGMAVFGPEVLKSPSSSLQDRLYIGDPNRFFQGDLDSLIQAETLAFEDLTHSNP